MDLRTKTRTLGTPLYTHPFCLSQASYFAQALSDGTIVLQEALPDGADVPPRLASTSAPVNTPGQCVPVLLIPPGAAGAGTHVPAETDADAEPFHLLSWGGGDTSGPGQACLLAAATQRTLCIFSLERFFAYEASCYTQACRRSSAAAVVDSVPPSPGSPDNAPARSPAPTSESAATAACADHTTGSSSCEQSHLLVPPPSSSWDLVACIPLSHPLLAMSWTQEGGGLMLSDTDRNVTMLTVQVEASQDRSTPPEATISRAWSAQTDAPQPLLAAGLHPGAPAASAHTRGGNGVLVSHRVLIWWPKLDATDEPQQQQQRQGSKDCTHSIGAEIIRHPVQVMAMQWSPLLPDPGGSQPSSTRPLDHGKSSGGCARGNEQLALMTVGVDRLIRVWVEVRMQDLLPAHLMRPPPPPRGHPNIALSAEDAAAAAAAAAALSLSQFCLALVIEPPYPSAAPLSRQTSLGEHPHHHHHQQPPQQQQQQQQGSLGAVPSAQAEGATTAAKPGGAHHTPLHQEPSCSWVELHASWCQPFLPLHTSPPPTSAIDTSNAGHTAPRAQPSAQHHPHGYSRLSNASSSVASPPNEAAIAARVHWLVASVSIHPATRASEHGHCFEEGACIEDCVFVWAVDGLASAAVAGMTRSGLAPGSAGAGPRAVLWGIRKGQRRVHSLASANGRGTRCMLGSPADSRLSINACVTYPSFVPVIHVAEALTCVNGGYAEARAYKAETVTQDGSVACPVTSILLHSRVRQHFLACPEPLHTLRPHPSMPELAASLSKAGTLGFWCLDPVMSLPLISASGGHASLPTHPNPSTTTSAVNHSSSPSCLRPPQPLLGSEGPLTALAWLPSLGPHPEAQCAQHQPYEGGVSHSQQQLCSAAVWTSYLACAAAGVVWVCAVRLPYLAVGSWQATHRHVEVLGSLLKIPLPQGAGIARMLLQVPVPPASDLPSSATHSTQGTHDPHSGPSQASGSTGLASTPQHTHPLHSSSSRAQLIALLAGSTADQQLTSAAATQPPTEPSKDTATAWGCWLLELPPPGHEHSCTTVGSADPAPPHDQPASHRQPSNFSTSGEHWCQLRSKGAPPVPHVVTHASLGSAHEGGTHSCAVTCCHQPLSSTQHQQPILTAGSDGSIVCWQPHPLGLAALAASLVHAADTADAAPSCVAVHELAQLCAAAAPPQLDGSERGMLRIWRARATAEVTAQEVKKEAAAASSGALGASHAIYNKAADARAQGDGGVQHCRTELMSCWELEAMLQLHEGMVPCAATWLPPAFMPAPCLALGYTSGLVQLFVRHREGGWATAAAHHLGCGLACPSSLAALPDGSLATAAGHNIIVLSNTLESASPRAPHTTTTTTSWANPDLLPSSLTSSSPLKGPCHLHSVRNHSLPLASLAWRSGGPLPLHSPQLLRMLVLKGRSCDACRLLRVLLHWLQAVVASSHADDAAQQQRLASLSCGCALPPEALHELQASLYHALTNCCEPFGVLHHVDGVAVMQQLARQAQVSPHASPPEPTAASAVGTAPTVSTTELLSKSSASEQPSGVRYEGATVPSPPEPTPQASSAVDTGQLDLSAFAAFPGLAVPNIPSAPPPPPPSPPQPPAAPPASSIETGMLDMSAFGGMGFSTGNPPPPLPQTQPTSSVETGLLDMSAFGGTGFSAGNPPPPSPSQIQPPSSVETGLLDMSAFGGMGFSASTPAPPSLPQTQPPSSVETGMLDMSAFSGMGFSAGTPASRPPHTQTQPTSSVATGMLDMNAFGGMGFGSCAPPPPTQPDLHGFAGKSGSHASSSSATPAVMHSPLPPAADNDENMPMGLRKLLRKQAEAAAAAAAAATPAAPPSPAFSSQPQHPDPRSSKKQGGALPRGWVTFPPCPRLRALEKGPVDELLSQEELSTLEQLLGMQHHKEGSDEAAGRTTSLLPSYLQDDHESSLRRAAADALASHLLRCLQLSQYEAKQLVQLAGALTQKAAPSEDTPGDAMDGLDSPACTFLAAARLAAKEEEEEQLSKPQPPNHTPTTSRSPSVRSLSSLSGTFSSGAQLASSVKSSVPPPARGAPSMDTTPGMLASSWHARMGILPGLSMLCLMHAAASGCQGALLEAALPHLAWAAKADRADGPSSLGTFVTSTQPTGRPGDSWSALKKLGAGLWLSDQQVVQKKAEALARAQYARRRDPYQCTLLYLALGKTSLLAGLFRRAGNTRVVEFLGRNFEEEASRRAAAKNAFALLGQHKYETAAGFFLLAGCVNDAVSVVAKECGDPQLALFVARLVEGTPKQGGAAWKLLQQELMPLAQASSDPCAPSLLLWIKGQVLPAIQSLCLPASVPIPSTPTPSIPTPSYSAAAATAAPLPGRQQVDPAALDFVLGPGVSHLAGRLAPVTLPCEFACLALHSAHNLESRGLPLLAMQSLLEALAMLPPPTGSLHDPPGASSHSAAAASKRQLDPSSNQHAGASGMHLHTLGPLCTRLLAACASLCGGAAGAPLAPVSLLSSPVPFPCSHHNKAPGSDQSGHYHHHHHHHQQQQQQQQQRRQQLVQDLVAHLSHAQHDLLQVDAVTQLQTSPQAILQMLEVMQQSMTVSCVRAVLPPLPKQPQQLLRRYASSAGSGDQRQQSSIEGTSSLGSRRNLPGISIQTSDVDSTVGDGLSIQGSPISRPGSAHSHGVVAHSTAAPLPPFGSAAFARSTPVSPGVPHSSRTDARGGRRSWSGHRPYTRDAAVTAPVDGAASIRRQANNTRAAAFTDADTGWFMPPEQVMGFEGDKCTALACCSAKAAAQKLGSSSCPVVAATGRSGLHSAEICLGGDSDQGFLWHQDYGGSSFSSSTMSMLGRQGSSLIGLIGQVLENVRWTPDPWAAMTSIEEPSLAMHRDALLDSSSVSRQGSSLSVSAAATHTSALAAHPDRDLFLSGTQQAEQCPPLPCTTHPPSSLQVNLLYTRQGSRFLGLGKEGLVATWRQDLPPDSSGLGYADWVHHCIPRRGHDMVVLNDRGSQFIVGGVATLCLLV
ncbi:hypothetical protein DUNSADRAFT_4438 [Dunaliella salina]|uniref:RAVE complex protein Rav1 C-terminal domain-containing protein n=1 Tax=Dunaliella salina TaxID=3046 RepID=A0ABQ7GS04_DUNSA|nr:hypothetical protein DUNSADRAFT_4438 [Dunaliella salina]|eukprot:KAF5837390.1 hypothetical protein DUNSADRAFT_4438 [Dunaliella salina]